jgi:hypothetical protein
MSSTSSLKRWAGSNHHWNAWASDRDRLLRIAATLDEHIRPIRSASKESRVTESTVKPNQNGPDIYEVRLEAREKEFSLTQMGSPEDVLAKVDPQTLDSVAVTVGWSTGEIELLPHHSIIFEDSRAGPPNREEDPVFAGVMLSRSHGATLRVNGSDPDWVRSTFADLRNEINKGAPWWRCLRSNWTWWPFTVLALLGAFYAFLSLARTAPLIFVCSSMVAGLALGTTTTLLAKTILPGFEIRLLEDRDEPAEFLG